MKTIHRRNLPTDLIIRGVEYDFMGAASALDDSTGADVCVKVMSARLEGVRDLHGEYYKPSSFYFKKKSNGN